MNGFQANGDQVNENQANEIHANGAQTNVEELPEKVHHYENAAEVPHEISKYWYQRHSIWSKYDEGIWMTDDAWFGVTPEPVATKIAEHMVQNMPPEKNVLIDCFAGAGGNAIAFALTGRFKWIFAIESDPDVIKCAKHNAEIYGVKDKIRFRKEDCFKAILSYKGMANDAIIFASPPWGGPGYRDDEVFNLSTMQPYSIDQIFTSFSRIVPNIVLFLPRTSNLNQVADYAKEGEEVQVVHYCMKGASKALCAYYGNIWGRLEQGEPVEE